MAEVAIKAEERKLTGSSNARKLRLSGKIPGVIYGAQKDVKMVSFDNIELSRLLKKEHTIINVQVGSEEDKTIVREIRVHPVTGNLEHIDFMRIEAGHKIKFSIPLNFIGSPKGVREGGTFSTVKDELEVEVLPRNIPEHIDVEVSELEMGDVIRVEDLTTGDYEVLDDPNDLVCQVLIPRMVEEETEEEGLLEEEMEEPEVITARKEESEEEESDKE